MSWTAFDFLVATALLCGAGALYEVVAWQTASRGLRRVAGIAILCVVLVIWAQGAVGIL